VYPHVVLVVGGAGERAPAAGLGAVVRPLPGVRSDVDFADVGGGERPAAALHRTFKRLLSCGRDDGRHVDRWVFQDFKTNFHDQTFCEISVYS